MEESSSITSQKDLDFATTTGSLLCAMNIIKDREVCTEWAARTSCVSTALLEKVSLACLSGRWRTWQNFSRRGKHDQRAANSFSGEGER